jgi:hypothetical protein
VFVCCKCCVLSGRGLCNELITHPEESYRLWCVVVCGDLENLKNEEAMTRVESQRHRKKSRYSYSVQEGRSGVRNPMGARFSVTVLTNLEAQPASSKRSIGYNCGGRMAGTWR